MSIGACRIRLLPETLINQIAAGEVIERPASVVKELVENSLDAGARRIEIDIEGGGTTLIRVRDDGCGIAVEDLVAALARHATSKIRSYSDLLSIASLGFRGEALPSIGSVSRLSLSSRTAEAETGWVIEMEGRAEPGAPRPLPHPVGTCVEVRELFFNTPARRKFLRSERTELLHIEDWVRRLALSRMDVGLSLSNHQRRVVDVRGGAPEKRLRALLRAAFFDQARPVHGTAEGLQTRGWLSLTPVNSNAEQLLILNGRAVRERTLQHAIRRACESEISAEPGGYLLYLEVEPETVDVNVHPAKYEVRFREPRRVHDFLCAAIRQALRAAPPVSAPLAAAQPRPNPSRVAEQRPAYAAQRPAASAPAPAPTSVEPRPSRLGQALTVVHGRYMAGLGPRGLVVTDLLWAFRAVLGTASAAQPLYPRALLIPERLALDPAGAARLLQHSEPLGRLGLTLAPARDEGLMLHSTPALFQGRDWGVILKALAATEGVAALLETLAQQLAATASSGNTPPALLHAIEQADAGPRSCPVWRELDEPALAALLAGNTGDGPR
ncbi:MAG: DNA mismatch repair endonuclease MutL [Gammaproteobacteria bacterium]